MNSASQQAKGILFGALELTDALQRHAYLDRECTSSTDLRAEVEQLLGLQAEADRFFLELSSQLNQVLSNASETKTDLSVQKPNHKKVHLAMPTVLAAWMRPKPEGSSYWSGHESINFYCKH